MTKEKRNRALLRLEQQYDRLSARAKKLVRILRVQPSATRRAVILKRLVPIDKQRSAIYGQMAGLWKSE